VLTDIPSNSVAVGIPARVLPGKSAPTASEEVVDAENAQE
jgi:serine acetyltransferase